MAWKFTLTPIHAKPKNAKGGVKFPGSTANVANKAWIRYEHILIIISDGIIIGPLERVQVAADRASNMVTKGKNFVDPKDIQLCQSYLAVGKDANTGTIQTSSTFWECITTHFQRAQPKSPSAENLLAQEQVTQDLARRQQFMRCVRERASVHQVRRQRRRRDPARMRPVQAIDQPSTGQRSAASNAVGGDGERPMGVKAAKEVAFAEADTEKTLKRIASATMLLARARTKRVRALEDANHLALLSARLDALDAEAC
jgi:hypothetical protein